MLGHVILGLLRTGGHAHGYELAKAYQRRTGVAIASGSFYREIAKLARDGWIVATGNPPGADARRLPYEISDHGRGVFDRWLTAIAPDDELWARLIFLHQLTPERRRHLATAWRDGLLERILLLGSERDAARTRPTSAGEPNLLPTLIERRIRRLRADLEILRMIVRDRPRECAPVRGADVRSAS